MALGICCRVKVIVSGIVCSVSDMTPEIDRRVIVVALEISIAGLALRLQELLT